MPRLFIGKGWPAINQGRKTKGLCEKRKVSAKDERFHEKRKVSRENQEVSLLIKWLAINQEKTEGFWESREASRETRDFCERRKVSRENREVSLLIKWPAKKSWLIKCVAGH